jgi:hypothetical protein
MFVINWRNVIVKFNFTNENKKLCISIVIYLIQGLYTLFVTNNIITPQNGVPKLFLCFIKEKLHGKTFRKTKKHT